MYYVSGLLNHLKAVNRCVAELGGSATMSVGDLSVDVQLGSMVRRLFPQFVNFRDGRRVYSAAFTMDVRAFIGWRPYEARRWPATADKLLFKEFARQAGVSVPDASEEIDASLERVIIKHRRSSFGEGIRGPFENTSEIYPERRLQTGEYYESFIPGRIAKAWYLNGDLLSLELRPPPFVTGDGRSTIAELAAARSWQSIDDRKLSWIVGAQGYRVQDVPQIGARTVVDFRYGSPYEVGSFLNENVLEALIQTEIGSQFQRAGYSLLAAIPEDMRHNTLITLDAVVDAEETVWFLEMNSNPAVHPDAYPALLRGLFGPSVS